MPLYRTISSRLFLGFNCIYCQAHFFARELYGSVNDLYFRIADRYFHTHQKLPGDSMM